MSPDFFVAAASLPSQSIPSGSPDGKAFADAIESRFGARPLLTSTRLSSPNVLTTPRYRPGPVPAMPPPPAFPTSLPAKPLPPAVQAHTFTPVTVSELSARLAQPRILVLDLRPHVAYSNGRLPHSLSLSIPSTLLKRPLFSLAKLSEMLPASVRRRLDKWPQADFIIVYDTDTVSLANNSIVKGLLTKFAAEGVDPSKLGWIVGGYQLLWREHKELVDQDPPSDDEDDAVANVQGSLLLPAGIPARALAPSPSMSLRARDLPTSAFSLTTATNNFSAALPTKQAFNPFFDNIRQNTELSHGITERIPLLLPASVRRRISELPFTWLQDIALRAGNDEAASEREGPRSSPDTLPVDRDVDDGTENLAMQFYKIELAEQRRLTGIMQHHSAENQQPVPMPSPGEPALTPTTEFPYSITAGIEKGGKNRYRNIWPFEHARVRLQTQRSSDDDYINASFVQPLGTSKKYIATQGPLSATFTDFWTLCWEQNVHVIVMLTREVEGSMVKCGKYWLTGRYGKIKLKLLETTGTPPRQSDKTNGDPFAAAAAAEIAKKTSDGTGTVKRVFEMTHLDYPHVPPRTVTQLQFLDWPDMNVPEDPQSLLRFMKAVNEVESAGVREDWEHWEHWERGVGIDPTTGIARHAYGNRPILLHCSAGVGRTGGYLVIDAILDGVRREMARRRKAGLPPQGPLEMADTTLHDAENAGMMSEAFGPTAPTSVVDVAAMDVDVQPDSGIVAGPFGDKREATVADVVPAMSKRPLAAWPASNIHDGPMRQWVAATAAARTTSLIIGRDTSSSPGQPPEDSPSPPASTDPSELSSRSSPSRTSKSPQPFPSSKAAAVPVLAPAAVIVDSRQRAISASSSSSPSEPRERFMSSSPLVKGVSQKNSSRPTYSSHPISTQGPSIFTQTLDGSRASVATTVDEEPASDDPAHGNMTSFDYVRPRTLHRRFSPPPLSSFAEPIREVVEDMRHQRMSLCQSLRQYVFVHQAIIEGALQLVDDENALLASGKKEKFGEREESPTSSSPKSVSSMGAQADVPPTPAVQEVDMPPAVATIEWSPGYKRKHSPTGAPTGLMKRPSIKR